MKDKKETAFLDALKTVNAYFDAAPQDRPRLLTSFKAANKTIADYARALELKAKMARINFKVAKGILDCTRLKMKLNG
jgi:hypothetical protein